MTYTGTLIEDLLKIRSGKGLELGDGFTRNAENKANTPRRHRTAEKSVEYSPSSEPTEAEWDSFLLKRPEREPDEDEFAEEL